MKLSASLSDQVHLRNSIILSWPLIRLVVDDYLLRVLVNWIIVLGVI